jgi:hypothetical protein
MGASRVHTFLTDRWYDLQVLDVAVGSEAGMGSCRDRVDVVFLADERRPSGDEGPGHRGRPKACISLCFEPGWITEDGGTLKLLNYLGVPLPIPDNFDWERRLANRRIAGLFGAPPRPGARNPLRDARPLDSPPEPRPQDLTLKPWEQRPAKVETRSPSDILSGLSPGWMATSGLPTDGMIALEPPAGITPIGLKADHRASLNLTLEPLEAHEVRHPYVAKLVIDGGDRIPSTKELGEEKLFFLHLFVTSGKPLSINGDEFTFITQLQAINSFREWAEAGYFVNRDENWKDRIVKCWYAFRTSLGEIAALEGLFSSFDHPCNSQPCYAVHLRHNALKSNLPKIEQVLAIVRTRVKSRKGRGRSLPLGSDSPGS